MKKFLGLFLVVACFLIFLGLSEDEDEEEKPSFVGIGNCKPCHQAKKLGNHYAKWKESKHSQAYQSIGSDDPDCLKCHSPYFYFSTNAELKEDDGVGCEACHGAGSEYKPLNIMKDRNLAVKNGLRVLDTDEQKIALCAQCHTEKNSYHETKKFDLKEFWEKIKHPKPSE